ncbi:MAG: DUF4321 domain-containing protein [candidate division Zixibacteria bacterium]|nr:DUF4321 domain-containing protein [candidate division Zixibacteria bacterium]
MKGRELSFLIVGIVMAAVGGAVVGDALGSFLPEGTIKTLFQKHVEIGLGRTVGMQTAEPLSINLYALSLVLGLTIRINLVSVLFVLLLLVYFRWWYL